MLIPIWVTYKPYPYMWLPAIGQKSPSGKLGATHPLCDPPLREDSRSQAWSWTGDRNLGRPPSGNLGAIFRIIGSQSRRPGERDECQERCDGRDAPFVVPGQYLHHFPTMWTLSRPAH